MCYTITFIPNYSSGAALWPQSCDWRAKPPATNECNHLNELQQRKKMNIQPDVPRSAKVTENNTEQ